MPNRAFFSRLFLSHEKTLCTDKENDSDCIGRVVVSVRFGPYNRSTLERFAAASRKGWEWAATNRQETLNIVMEEVMKNHVPTNRILQQCMLDEIIRLQLDGQTSRRTFILSANAFERANRLLLESGLINKKIRYDHINGL